MSVSLDMATLDPSSICRCCLSDRRDTLRSLFDSSIRDMYVACTSLEITPNDGLPGSICAMCIFKCISWSSFKQLCERSELMLKIQFNIQTQPLSDPDREDESKKSNKNKTPLKVQELTDHTVIDMIDDDPNIESNCTANESTDDAQTILVDSTSDGTPNIISECASSEPVVDQEDDDDDDLLTIVDDMEYLKELTDTEEEKFEIEVTPTHVSPMRAGSKSRKRSANNRKTNLPCDKCELTFRSADRLEAHARTHLGQKPELCTICNKGFDQPRALSRHRAAMHSDDKVFPCPQCDKSYKYKTSLTLHLKIHANGKCFVCDDCGKSFDRIHNLQSHMLSHSTETPFDCDHCEKRFKNEVMLRNHQLRHQGVKKFACETCGKLFVTTAELRTHSRMHTGQKPFKCSDCDKAFTTKSHLAVHFRTHTGVRPYACDTCDQTFAHLKVLKHHRMIHTGERPHTCKICDRRFRQRSTLTIHMQTHRSGHDDAASSADEETPGKDN